MGGKMVFKVGGGGAKWGGYSPPPPPPGVAGPEDNKVYITVRDN